MGPVGCGQESALLQLLARFYDVDAGAVRLGGADVRAIGAESLMAQFAIVFQDVYLFEGTIEDNVRFGRPGADEEVCEAAAAARLDEVSASPTDGLRKSVRVAPACRAASASGSRSPGRC